MPEGPEIWRSADALARVLDGQTLRSAELTLPPLKRYGALLSGELVHRVQARGKAIVTHFGNGLCLYSHNQLYGRWYVTRAHHPPNTNRTLRVALHTDRHTAWLYSASDIAVIEASHLDLHPYLAKLGVEALDPVVTWRDVASRLQQPQFRGRRLAGLYLDQHCVAGIGNYLRSEILFDAGIHPMQRPMDLTRGEIGRLARSTLTITRRSLQTGGITNPPARASRMKREGARYQARRFAIFARAGLPCYSCGTEILRETMSGRRLYLCPACQPAPRRNQQRTA